MLPRADLNATRPPTSVEAATRPASGTDPRLELFQRLSQIAIGRELQVTVQSLLDDGSYLVKVADSTARMALPVGTRVGEQLSMVFVAREPRPTFLLDQPGGSAPATLSLTARLIDHILQTARQNGDVNAVAGRTPLLAAAAAVSDPSRLASGLQAGLTHSGLFYESHLQDWVNGSRTLQDLAKEPQTRMGGAALQQERPVDDLTRLAANLKDVGEGVHKLLDLMRDSRLPAANPHLVDADVIAKTDSQLPALDPEAARLINLQLNTLEQQQARWHGELWPGQELEWDVSRDEAEGDTGDPEQAAWTSTVRFELPHLGAIVASIRLVGNSVQLQVSTGSDDAATVLRERVARLSDALAATGSQLDGFLVKQDEKP